MHKIYVDTSLFFIYYHKINSMLSVKFGGSQKLHMDFRLQGVQCLTPRLYSYNMY